MAKVTCKVKFSQFHWNRAGYAQVMNSGGVQSLVEQPASRVFNAVSSQADGYTMKQVQGRISRGYIVGVDSGDSYRNELENNALLKALGGL